MEILLNECVDIKEVEDLQNVCVSLAAISKPNTLSTKVFEELATVCSNLIADSDSEPGDTIFLGDEKAAATILRNYYGYLSTSSYTERFKGMVIRRADTYGDYVVAKGSMISNTFKPSCSSNIKKMFEELVKNKKVDRKTGRVLDDFIVHSLSAAASLASGNNVNGKLCLSKIDWDK